MRHEPLPRRHSFWLHFAEKNCFDSVNMNGILSQDIREKLHCFDQTEEGRRFWRGRRPSSAFRNAYARAGGVPIGSQAICIWQHPDKKARARE